MSDFHGDPTHPRARKAHRCTACLAEIKAGELYTQQSGFYEGHSYRNRYHNECWAVLSDEGVFEFTPGEIAPPQRLVQTAA